MQVFFTYSKRWIVVAWVPFLLMLSCSKPVSKEPVIAQNPLTGYWDFMDQKQDSLRSNPEQLVSPALSFFMVLERTGKGREEAVEVFMDKVLKSDTVILRYMMDNILEKYLYDPGSPIRNDAMYLMMIRHLIDNERVDTFTKSRFVTQAELLSQNLPGNKANNFRFADKKGIAGDLYSLKPIPVLLYFNNPECEACKLLTELLADSEPLRKLIANRGIQVISVYTDHNLQAWKSTLTPDHWQIVRALDPDHINSLYDLRAIPSLYLLDEHKYVLLKDARPEEIIKAITHLLNK